MGSRSLSCLIELLVENMVLRSFVVAVFCFVCVCVWFFFKESGRDKREPRSVGLDWGI